MPISKNFSASKNKDQQRPAGRQAGVIPLFILIAAGIAVLVGGTYIVRGDFIKTGKSGKAALDTEKINQQVKNPTPLPSFTPTPKPELAPNSFTYQPSPNPSQIPGSSASLEPGFTINPPAGWEKLSPQGKNGRASFQSPEVDKEQQEDNLVARVQSVISVHIFPGSGSLDAFTQGLIVSSQNAYAKLQIVSDMPTTFAGQEARKVELKFSPKNGIPMYAVSYLVIKDGFWIQVAGNSLESAWGKRVGEIESSLKSFKFTN